MEVICNRIVGMVMLHLLQLKPVKNIFILEAAISKNTSMLF